MRFYPLQEEATKIKIYIYIYIIYIYLVVLPVLFDMGLLS